MDIYSFLAIHNIAYERFDHAAVFTCEQANELCPEMPGISIKNLFLYDKKNNDYFLVIVQNGKRVDLKELKHKLDVSHLSFAPEEHLQKYLGVTPGSVTVLGLVNDITNIVTIIFDADLIGNALQCHPLINTATLVIQPDAIKKILDITGHTCNFLEIPER